MTGAVKIGSREACVLMDEGRRLGRLVVRGLNRNQDVVCDCDCGETVAIEQQVWLSGNRYQCDACDAHAKTPLVRQIIGDDDTYETLVGRYRGIIDRCTNPANPNYPNYGAKGVLPLYDDHDHFALHMWCMKFRYGDPRTTDRIDVYGHYEPDNVRLALPVEQARNKRNTVVVDTGDESISLAELAERHGITPNSSEYGKLVAFVSRTKQDAYERVIGKIAELTDDEEFA